jgi:hypothetical protein
MLKPQIKSEEDDSDHNNNKWINYLINGSRNEFKRFLHILNDECHGCLGFAAIKYRQRLFEEGKRGNISLEQLNSVWDNFELLKVDLQELFLEYIDQESFEYIMTCININKWTAEGLYNEHQKNKNNRIACIVGVPMR